MDIMKDALLKRKKDLENNFKNIVIELHVGTKEDDAKDEEKQKKLGLAPEVKDTESPKEPKLMAEVESADEHAKESPLDEKKETADMMAGKPLPHEGDASEIEPIDSAMVELPKGREPKSLHEKATALMMKAKDKKK